MEISTTLSMIWIRLLKRDTSSKGYMIFDLLNLPHQTERCFPSLLEWKPEACMGQGQMGQPRRGGVDTPLLLQLWVDPLVFNNIHMPDQTCGWGLACRTPLPCVDSLNEILHCALPCTGKINKVPALLHCLF